MFHLQPFLYFTFSSACMNILDTRCIQSYSQPLVGPATILLENTVLSNLLQPDLKKIDEHKWLIKHWK